MPYMTLTRVLMLAATLSTALAVSELARAQEIWKIGVPASISGRYVAYGVQAKNGVEYVAAVAEDWSHLARPFNVLRPGAYVGILGANRLGMPLAVTLIGALAAGAVLGAALAVITGHMRGVYFAITILAASEGLRPLVIEAYLGKPFDTEQGT